MTTLVTGAAGFIGMHVADALLARGTPVIGIDSLNSYYNVGLKHARVARLRERRGDAFRFDAVDFSDRAALAAASDGRTFDRIIHLGAQAGVRYSIQNPHAYVAGQSGRPSSTCWSSPATAGVAHMVYASLQFGLRRQYETCRSRSRIGSIIRCRSTPPPRRRTS